MAKEHYEIRDRRFEQLIHVNADVEILWSEGRWTEGPAYLPAARYLIWSDIPNDRLMRWDEASGIVSVFEQGCRNQNGHTVDRMGRLISCEHRTRAVTRREFDGTRTVLADRFEGKPLNSPNDVVEASDGSIWFTDPTYGIDSDYEGDAAASEIGGSFVYRIDPDGTLERVITDMVQPNGLAFSPDERILYVSDTGRTHNPDCKPVIRAYPVLNSCSRVGSGSDLAECEEGLFDGFRVDTNGNIWSSAGDGVHCFAPDGTLIGKIYMPRVVANVCFGGPKRNRLFICATNMLLSVFVNARGCGL